MTKPHVFRDNLQVQSHNHVLLIRLSVYIHVSGAPSSE